MPARRPWGAAAGYARTFFDFAVGDLARHQLMNLRTIPGFEPSAEAYAPAVRGAARSARRHRRAHGITRQEDLDLYVALVGGLVDAQLANDPGGDRWSRLARPGGRHVSSTTSASSGAAPTPPEEGAAMTTQPAAPPTAGTPAAPVSTGTSRCGSPPPSTSGWPTSSTGSPPNSGRADRLSRLGRARHGGPHARHGADGRDACRELIRQQAARGPAGQARRWAADRRTDGPAGREERRT